MARIARFFKLPLETNRVHDSVECGYKSFEEDGKTILQLNTYGSEERKQKGTISQSIQVDAEAAATLIDLLRGAFPGL